MPYSYEDFFKYKGKEHSISNNKTGWYLVEFNAEYQSFTDTNELLAKATIDGKHLKGIWDEVEVKAIQIF